MSISSRITAIEEHIGDIYDTLELGGADLTNVDKNIFNIKEQIKKRYFDYIVNGIDEIWNNWEKVTATDVTEATLNDTDQAPMKIKLKGNTVQDGTPTPDNPIPIQNVVGNVEIKIQNKNLFGVSFQRGYWKTDGTYNTMTENTTTMSTPKFKLKAGSYIISNSKITSWQWYIINWTDGNYSVIQKYSTKTFTLTRDSILSFQFNTPKGSGVAVEPYLEELTEYMMLKQGSTESPYVPHEEQNLPLTLGDIELCKIDTAQDYFYKENNKWYLHKEIGKVIFDGSSDENWLYSSSSSYPFRINHTDLKPNSTSSIIYPFICNYYRGFEASQSNYSIVQLANTARIYFRNTDITSKEDWMLWLSTHNTEVYYPLEIPTNTEITDTTLVNQLEVIRKAQSYNNQTNISQTSEELPFILDIEALKKI